MDKKTYAIGILAVTATLLLLGNLLVVQPDARANDAIKDRDYQMITAHAQQGGDVLYVVDNLTGQMAIFQWDAQRRVIIPKDVGPIESAFRAR